MSVKDYRPLGIGDAVRVLRACKLPIEDVLATSVIVRTSRSVSGETLYWIRDLPTARTARELRRIKTLTDVYAEQSDQEEAGIRLWSVGEGAGDE